MSPVRPLHSAALGALLTLLFATPARAEVDLGSLDIFVQDSPTSPVPKGLVLGGAVIGGDARYQGQDDTALAVPGAVYFGEQFMFLGDRARYYFHKDENVALYGYGHSIFRENPYAAVNYYQRAADRWHIGAMVALAHYYAKGDKLRKADLVQATRWMQIAASVDGRYKGYAQRMMAALPENQQKQVAQSASSWLRRRGIRPEPFPYAAPLNDDPPRIL